MRAMVDSKTIPIPNIHKRLLSTREAWELSLLHHLRNLKRYVLPGITFEGLGFGGADDVNTVLYPNTTNSSGIIAPTGTIFTTPKWYLSADNRWQFSSSIDHVEGLALSKNRIIDYFEVAGTVSSTLQMTGNKGMWIWFDPYDVNNPVRYNTGPTVRSTVGLAGTPNEFWRGALTTGSSPEPYSPPLETGTFSGQIAWTQNPFQQYATNWMCFGTEEIYPPPVSTTAAGYNDIAPPTASFDVRGTSYLIYPISVSMAVTVTNNTAFTQTGMRARACGSFQHRLLDRVENVASGFYGLLEPVIKANEATLFWSGDKWSFPIRHPVPNAYAAPAPPTFTSSAEDVSPATSTSMTGGANFGAVNWCSLQKMLAQNFPVLEIYNNSQDPLSVVTLSVQATVHYGISPLDYLQLQERLAHNARCLSPCPGGFPKSVHKAASSQSTPRLTAASTNRIHPCFLTPTRL